MLKKYLRPFFFFGYEITLPKLFLILFSLIIFAYSFRLSYKRFDNYEFGKFDLGNMSQIVWNTAHGNFMLVTDQFGANINRLGMSHADYILVFFAPLYWIFPHAMLLVFVQNLFLISAVIPIYLLAKKFTKSDLIASISGAIYLLYPALGYLLVWSEYHGVTHISPLIIWMFWYLERTSYDLKTVKNKIIFWTLFVLMLFGKEQVGAILGCAGAFVFFKNKKLGISMFMLGFVYTLFCFLYLIPLYQDQRTDSVAIFLALTSTEDLSILDQQSVIKENFFLNRYKYLGDGYADIVKNVFTDPKILTTIAYEEDKLENLNFLYKPFGYLTLIVPVWIIAAPDYAIALLADVKGFLSIENQRVVFIMMTLFISYLLVLKILSENSKLDKFYLKYIYATICLILTFSTSLQSSNPIFLNGESLIKNKIIKKVYSQEGEIEEKKEIGQIRKGRIPVSEKFCKDYMVGLVNKYNPSYYSGPNPMGDHTANRYMNAMFPAEIDNSEFFITDIYDFKAYQSLRGLDPFKSNIAAVNKTVSTGEYKYLASCDTMSAFVKKSFINDYSVPEYRELVPLYSGQYTLEAKNGNSVGIKFNENSFKEDLVADYQIEKLNDISDGQVAYWYIENDNHSLKFLDFNFIHLSGWKHSGESDEEQIENPEKWFKYDFEFIKEILPAGEYKVYYGFGDPVSAREIYLTNILL